MRSIRRFLIIVLLATVTLVNFLAAIHGYRSSMAAAEQLFDQQLLQIARIFANKNSANKDSTTRNTIDTDSGSAIMYQIWDGERLVDRSANAPAAALVSFTPGLHEINFEQSRWRVVVLDDNDGRFVLVAEQTDNRFILAENVVNESVLPLVLSVPIIGILIWLIVSWGLMPLQNLARELRQKHPEDLSPIRNLVDTKELGQLALSVNDLLSRLQGALERESRFAANAAHELRTPLSVLKVHLYNLRNESAQNPEALADLEQGVDRLGHLIEQIFALHVSSQDRRNLVLKPLNLTALCREAISDNFSLFALKQQDIELMAAEDVPVTANRQSLRVLLDNLIINASKYTPVGGKVFIAIDSIDNEVELRVEDSGPGILEEEREQVFERFYRVGGDHHSSGESGCGLGLSVVKQIADNHGARIKLEQSSRLGGLRVEIHFPRRP